MTLASSLRLVVAVLVLPALAGCTRETAQSKEPPKRPPVPVAVASVEEKDVAVQITAIGAVEANATVSVRAQVGGELMKVHIKEGQDVKKGELLFTIDPRPFEATLAQAQATLAKDRVQVQQARAVLQRDQARIAAVRAALQRDQAQFRNAEAQERRYAELVKQGLISQEQYEQIRTNSLSLAASVQATEADVRSAEETVRADEAAVKSAEETVRADEAAVASARLQLAYTSIRAPMAGRTGTLQLHEGNVVRAGGQNDSTLLVINQTQPVYVTFTVPQQQLPEIKRYMAAAPLAVDAIPAGDRRPAQGVVTFIDNAIDPTTGTIRIKATFPNKDNRLWPQQFANVTVTLATEANALVVPSAAVQTSQQGAIAFVVKPDSTIDLRRLTITRMQGGDAIVAKGLAVGEKVVVDGTGRLTAGTKVEVRAPAPPPGGAPKGPEGGAPKKGPEEAPKKAPK